MSRRAAQQLRRAVYALQAEYEKSEIDATYDSRRRRWEVAWSDGPTPATVRARLTKAAPELSLDLLRSYSYRAYAVAAVELAMIGTVSPSRRYWGWGALRDTMDDHLADRVNPAEAHGRIGALADALVAVCDGPYPDPEAIAEPLTQRGLSWLLTPRQSNPDTSGGVVMTPIEHLTNRYADTGQLTADQSLAWQWRLHPAPARALVTAALTDEELDLDGRLAVLALLGELRAEQKHLEDQALTAAHEAGASWRAIGTALGISGQAAHERAGKRSPRIRLRRQGKPDRSR